MNSAKKYYLEDYIERANEAGNVEALFNVFVDTIKVHGLDRAIFSLSTEHDDIAAPAQLGIIHNYPMDWLDYYFQNGFNHIDPVLIHASQTVGMFEWKEIPRYLEVLFVEHRTHQSDDAGGEGMNGKHAEEPLDQDDVLLMAGPLALE